MNRSPMKNYTPKFKQQAVELVHLGKSVTEVAQELNIAAGNFYTWVRKSKNATKLGSKNQGVVGDMTETDELRILRPEVSYFKLRNDTLKKATLILGTKSQPRTAR